MSSTLDKGSPPVSVILPVLNEAKHLRAAAGSVLNQDYSGDIKVVLSLGPSTDSSNAVAEDLAKADPRVSFVHNSSGRTPTGLNLAFAATRYPIVARVDGHSHIPNDYLRNAVELLQRTGADNVGGLMSARGETHLERAIATAM